MLVCVVWHLLGRGDGNYRIAGRAGGKREPPQRVAGAAEMRTRKWRPSPIMTLAAGGYASSGARIASGP